MTIYESHSVTNELGMAIQCAICLPDVPLIMFLQHWWHTVCPSLRFRNAGFSIFLEVFVTSKNDFLFSAW